MLLILLACTRPPGAGSSSGTDTWTDTGTDTGTDPGTSIQWLIDEPFDTLDPADWTWGTWALGLTQLDPAQASLANGSLRLALDEVDGTWRGAELAHILPFRSGRFEARIAAPEEPGSVCALFLYAEDDQGRVHEIDVELLSAEPDTVYFGTYAAWTEADGYEDGPTRQAEPWQRAGFSVAEWHDYAIVWTKDLVRFEVDGRTVTESDRAPSHPATLRMNHWTTSTWPEVQGPPTSSSTCRVDRVRARALGPEDGVQPPESSPASAAPVSVSPVSFEAPVSSSPPGSPESEGSADAVSSSD